MVGVHAESDVGLLAVASKMTFSDQDSHQETAIEVGGGWRRFTVGFLVERRDLFHRWVSRETRTPQDSITR